MNLRSVLLSVQGLCWSAIAMAQTPPPRSMDQNLKTAGEELGSILQFGTAFENPSSDQKARIIQSFKNLEAISHAAKTTAAMKSAVDPVMRYVSLDMPAQFARLQSVYSKGNYAHARYIFKQTVHYCVSCHVVASPKNPGLLPFPAPLKGTSELEKAEYFADSRKLKDAMLAYEKALVNKQFMVSQPQQWMTALENLLAITITDRNDAHITLEMCSRLLENGGLSAQQKDLLTSWRTSAKSWTKEKLKPRYNGAGFLSRAQQLIEQGNALSQKGRSWGYVEYLRAMNMVNELAIRGETEMLKASGFRLAGEVSEKLKSVTVWMYPEVYYEACVRAVPHTSESQRCWKNYEAFQSREPHTLWDAEATRILKGMAL